MSDHDLEKLNTAFSDLRLEAELYVRPPGIKAAREAARRRRGNRATALSVLVVALIAIPLTAYHSFHPQENTPTAIPVQEAPAESMDPSWVEAAATAATRLDKSGVPPVSAKSTELAYAPIWIEAGTSGFGVDLPKSGAGIAVPFGLRVWGAKSASNVKLTVNLADILARVQVISVSSPCGFAGVLVTCDFGTTTEGAYFRSLTLASRTGAPAGPAGQVNLEVTAKEPSWFSRMSHGRVSVSTYDQMADLITSSTVPTGKVGDTVTVTSTLKNDGPNVAPYVELSASQPFPGTEYSGGEGCEVTTASFACRIETIQVGTTIIIKLHIRILRCDPAQRAGGVGTGTVRAIGDPIAANDDFQVKVKVTGC
ncbi:MAG TPA: hypothetical protein DGT23_25890 [Micromonosporaceae bacterium]|nr:hypothetical protein [Micromonosporaceae bacterium]